MALDWFRLSFIFTAGVFALLSPCSYPMLPGYISYYLSSNTQPRRAILSGIVCSSGLISIFSLIGSVAIVARTLIQPYLNLLEIAAGAIIIAFGVAILKKVTIPIPSIHIQPSRRRGYLGLFSYGIAYGMATIGCSAPIFFSIIFYTILAQEPLGGLLTFVVYALGMAAPLMVITYLVAKAKRILLDKIRSAMPSLQRFSGIFLILIGSYLIAFYYYTNIASS